MDFITFNTDISNVNINGDGDPYNRYKMPSIIIQNMNDNTTIIVNLDEISKSLNRNPIQIISALQKKLNTRGNVKKKSLNGCRSNKIYKMLCKNILKWIFCVKTVPTLKLCII